MSINAQQAVIFDLGGVLLKEAERNLAAVLPPELTRDETRRIFNRAFDFVQLVSGTDYKHAWIVGSKSGAEIVAYLLNNIDKPEFDTFFQDATERELIKRGAPHILLPQQLSALTVLDEQGHAFVKQCKAQHIRVLILSNWDPASFGMLQLKFKDFFSLFDENDIFIPRTIGYSKPDQRCYTHVLHAASLDPANTYFVDDSARNVQGARDVGIKGIHHVAWEDTISMLQQQGLNI